MAGNGYKFKEAKCIDNNGDEIKEVVTYEDGKITLTTNKTVYCTVYFDYKGTINILRENDINKNLSEDLPEELSEGMYRYQGTDDVHNWICFGTTNNCGTNEDKIDKYMYRIIGITKEGQLYLLKETFLKEGNTTDFAWNDKHATSGEYAYTCDSKICPEWGQNTLFKRINGASNGKILGVGTCYPSCDNANTDIFVDSSEYDYLKSGDENGTNDGIGNDWYNLIEEHSWMYGDSTISSYNGDTLRDIETGKTETAHYVQKSGESVTIESQNYKWPETNKVSSKVSLLYLHDIAYAYANCSSDKCILRGNPENRENVKNSWIHFQKDGYNMTIEFEWLSTRWGVRSLSYMVVSGRTLHEDGTLVYYSMVKNGGGVRPVFYLKSDVKISKGGGTKTNPYILDLTEDSF